MSDKNNGSKKFQDAVDKVTNKGNGASETAPQAIGDVKDMIGTWNVEEMNALAQSGDYEFAPQMLSLEEGQKIAGILESEGPGADFTNPTTGEVRHVKSWVIRSENGSMRASILSSAQLDTKMPPFMGSFVVVARDKDVKSGNGFKVANYFVGGPKRADGVPRDFSPKMIAGPETQTQAALPAAGETGQPPTTPTPVAPAPAPATATA